MDRIDGRPLTDLRPVRIKKGINPYAEGSCEVCFGNTKVHVTASVETDAPRWMGPNPTKGWITAEYGMLPRSTHTRCNREAAKGKQGGRTLEIQRLIGRSLRQAIDLSSIPGITIRIDCDVLCADGGTRTASISGGWVALAEALKWIEGNGHLKSDSKLSQIVALSVGMKDGHAMMDLCYEEDSTTDFDLNLVFNEKKELIEIQGTGEGRALAIEQVHKLVDLGSTGVSDILTAQKSALNSL